MKKSFYNIIVGITLFSLLSTLFCICITLIRLFSFDLSLTTEGVKVFFSEFAWCLDGIKITLSILGVLFVVDRLSLLKENQLQGVIENKSKNLQDKLNSIKDDNEKLFSIIGNIKYDILETVIRLNAGIDNKEQLIKLFNIFIKNKVGEFEKGSKKFKQYHSKYLDGQIKSYSIEQFIQIQYYLFLPTLNYSSFEEDIYKLYMEEVNRFAQGKLVTKEKYYKT